MMAEEKLRRLQRDEAALVAALQAQQDKPADFNPDGIVDYERWAALAEKKHILVLLKETNGLDGSLAEFLRHGGSKTYYRTWNNVARWTSMILDGRYWEFVPKDVLDDMVRNIAAVNLKKSPGGSSADPRAVREAARRDAALLKRQIQLYEPDLILACGWGLVSNILHDEIFADNAAWVKPNGQTALWYYESRMICKKKETLVISMPHPNRAAKRWTLELKKILQITGRL